MQGIHSDGVAVESKPIVKVFWCYAPENRRLRDDLEQHLSALKYAGHIQMWHDREILPGALWEQESEMRLETADLVLLLVSAHFLGSTVCWEKHMKRALQRWALGKVSIIPILASPVDCQGTLISHLEMLPTGGKAITDWSDRQKACADVATGIRKAVNALLARQWKQHGDACSGQEQYDLAFEAYEEALHLDPGNPYFHHAKGNALSHLQRFEEAIAAYDKAIEMKSDFGLAYKGRGDALDAFAPFAYEKYKRLAERSYRKADMLEVKEIERRVNE